MISEIIEREFQTPYRLEKQQPEINNGPYLVETAGYEDQNMKIDSFIEAGLRLKEYRQEQFDQYLESFENNYDEDYPLDPTRSPNMDIVDIQNMAEANNKKFMESQNAKKKAIKEYEEKVKAENDRIISEAKAIVEKNKGQ